MGAASGVVITPSSVTLKEGATQQFSANTAVTWSASCGTISTSGLYTAPNVAETCTVTGTATNGSGSGTATVMVSATGGLNYITWKNDNMRTGQQRQETTLTPSNVNSTTFGQKFADSVDGRVYAQPLVVSGVSPIAGGTHNVVFVATEHDSVYAFDADAAGAPLWHVSFLINGATTVPQANVNSTINPEIGITSTPVIDLASGTLFVVAETLESGSYVFRLHALDIHNGAEKNGGPVRLSATGFAPKEELQRGALLLANGNIYIAFASQGDTGSWQGWVFAFNAGSLSLVKAWNPVPSGLGAGIWNGGTGPSADSNGEPGVRWREAGPEATRAAAGERLDRRAVRRELAAFPSATELVLSAALTGTQCVRLGSRIGFAGRRSRVRPRRGVAWPSGSRTPPVH